MPTYTPSPNITAGSTQASGTYHQFTGSMNITGALTVNGVTVTGGGGGGGGLVTTYSNAGNNRVLTSVNGSTINGESNLSFDGSTLTVTGDVTASQNISASSFYGDGSNLTGTPGISWDGSTANGVATFKDADEATVESNLTFDGSTLTVTGDITSTGNTILGNASSDYHQVTGTLSISGSTLLVEGGDIKVSSSAQYTVEGGSDTFVGLMKFYNTGEGEEQYISGAVWNISQERVELRNFGLDTGYKAFAADSIYTDAQFGFLGGDMTISDGNISAGSLNITGEPLTLIGAEETVLYLKTGYKEEEGEVTQGSLQIIDSSETPKIWSAHSVTGTLINGGLEVSGNFSSNYHSASVTTATLNASCSHYNIFNYDLASDVTLTALDPVTGSSYLFFFRQDATGGREVTFSGFKFPGGTAPTFSDAAGAVDIVSGISDGTSIYADITKNFS